jgi:hypothetical protein
LLFTVNPTAFALKFIFVQTHATYGLRSPYRNLKSGNSRLCLETQLNVREFGFRVDSRLSTDSSETKELLSRNFILPKFSNLITWKPYQSLIAFSNTTFRFLVLHADCPFKV